MQNGKVVLTDSCHRGKSSFHLEIFHGTQIPYTTLSKYMLFLSLISFSFFLSRNSLALEIIALVKLKHSGLKTTWWRHTSSALLLPGPTPASVHGALPQLANSGIRIHPQRRNKEISVHRYFKLSTNPDLG